MPTNAFLKKYLNALEEKLMEEDTGFSDWKEALRGETDLGEYAKKSAKNWGKRKIREILEKYTTPKEPDYLLIKEIVTKYVNGAEDREFGLQGYETSIEDPDLKGNLGANYGNVYKVPGLSEIPKILKAAIKEKYEKVTEIFGNEYKMSRDMQDYIRLHEIVESVYMRERNMPRLSEKEHGKMEGYMQIALKEMGRESVRARDIYRACLAINSARDINDPFRKEMEKYNDINKELILEMV